VLQHSVNSRPADGDSVFSSAWSTDVSQVNPERYKISNFGESEFVIQNLSFYRKQYEQVFKFWEPDPTNQVILNIIDDGDPLYQQYLTMVIAESSVVARKMHGPDRQTLLAGACKQRNEAGFQSYLQRCLNLHSPSSQNPKLFNSGPENELKSTFERSPGPVFGAMNSQLTKRLLRTSKSLESFGLYDLMCSLTTDEDMISLLESFND